MARGSRACARFINLDADKALGVTLDWILQPRICFCRSGYGRWSRLSSAGTWCSTAGLSQRYHRTRLCRAPVCQRGVRAIRHRALWVSAIAASSPAAQARLQPPFCCSDNYLCSCLSLSRQSRCYIEAGLAAPAFTLSARCGLCLRAHPTRRLRGTVAGKTTSLLISNPQLYSMACINLLKHAVRACRPQRSGWQPRLAATLAALRDHS